MAATLDRMLFVGFVPNQPLPSAEELWAKATGESYGGQIFPVFPGSLCAAEYQGIALTIQSQPGRMDLSVQAKPMDSTHTQRTSIPDNEWDKYAGLAIDAALNALSGTLTHRLAIVYEAAEEFSTKHDAVLSLLAELPNAWAPKGTEEYYFQVGVREPLKTVDGETLLAIRRWNTGTMVIAPMVVGLAPNLTASAQRLVVSHVADVGTSGADVIRPREREPVYWELAKRAAQLLNEGVHAFPDAE